MRNQRREGAQSHVIKRAIAINVLFWSFALAYCLAVWAGIACLIRHWGKV